jgi:hypothetical protein
MYREKSKSNAIGFTGYAKNIAIISRKYSARKIILTLLNIYLLIDFEYSNTI